MKYFFSLFLFAGIASLSLVNSFYDQPLKNIDTETVNLQSFRGKKVLLLVLPGSAEDSSITIPQLSSLLSAYPNLVIIGVPAEETGYNIANKETIKAKYAGLSSRFILTEGMKVSKDAGTLQSPLFNWLTHKEENGYFDTDVLGAGHKFFVHTDGRLYGVISGNTALSNPVIERILSK